MAELDQYTTVLKSFARANAVPLDKDEVWESLSAAEAYLKSSTAYAGQTIQVKMEDGQYQSFVLQPDIEDGEGNTLTLKQVGMQPEDIKNQVQLVDSLPGFPEENVIYILPDRSGYVWTGYEYKLIFEELIIDLSPFARLDGAFYTGPVYLAANPVNEMEAATKNYVDNALTWGSF